MSKKKTAPKELEGVVITTDSGLRSVLCEGLTEVCVTVIQQSSGPMKFSLSNIQTLRDTLYETNMNARRLSNALQIIEASRPKVSICA